MFLISEQIMIFFNNLNGIHTFVNSGPFIGDDDSCMIVVFLVELRLAHTGLTKAPQVAWPI